MTDTHQGDIIRRGLRRDQPVKLTKEELLEKMTTFTVKDAERDELVDELQKETKKRKQQIEDLDDEIGHLKRCIRTGEEDRSVPCYERLDRRSDGTWEVVLIRQDTEAVVERRSAHAAELQRHLPSEYSGQPTVAAGSVLEDARAQQAAATTSDGGDDVPGNDDDADAKDSEGEDEGEASTTTASGAAPVCGLRYGKDGAACLREWKHEGEHDNGTNHWKARPPRKPLEVDAKQTEESA